MMCLTRVAAAVTAALCLCGSAIADPPASMTIIENGQPVATLVTAADIEQPFDEGIRNVTVRDLISVVARMTGACLPVVRDEVKFTNGPEIHLGLTQFVREANLIPANLPTNGYRIVLTSEGDQPRLVIAGLTPEGTSHGVYDFLTQELGIMWGTPDPLFEELPHTETVTIGPIDRTERPDFVYRYYSGVDADWDRRNRVDGGREMPYSVHGHALFHYVPVSQYGDHPEYFPLWEGQRKIPPHDDATRFMICLTNPEVIQIVIDYARRFFDENPGRMGISLCASDTDEFCTCERCAALDSGGTPFPGEEYYNSDSYFTFVDTVAKALLQSHPDRYVTAYAYWTTIQIPRVIQHLPPNVAIHLTQDPSQYFDAEYQRADTTLLSQWSQVADQICIYEYHNLGWMLPRNYPHLMADRIRYLLAHHVVGYYAEMFTHWAHSAPMQHVITRLTWDSDLDTDEILDEFYTKMFHEAAPQMKRFYDIAERAWLTTPRNPAHMAGRARMWEQFTVWRPDVREEAWVALNEALQVATTPRVRARIENIRERHVSALMWSRAFEMGRALTTESSEADIRTVLRTYDDAMASYHGYLETDPAYHRTYMTGHKVHELLKWTKLDLATCIDSALVGRPELRARLIETDATFADAVNTASNRRMPGYIRFCNRAMEERGIWPDYIPRSE